MPGRWVTRKDTEGFLVSEPLACFAAHAIVAEPGVRTVEQCVRELLADGETVQGDGEDLPIVKDGRVVGVIEVRRRAS